MHSSFGQHFHSFFSPNPPYAFDLLLQGFISYSWPRGRQELSQLQARLTHLREDLRPTGLDVTLDIVDLKPGMGIDEFMKQGVTTAEVIFLVGTPDYLRRVPEPKNEVSKLK